MVWYNLYVISFTVPAAIDSETAHHGILIVPSAEYTDSSSNHDVFFMEYHGIAFDKHTGARIESNLATAQQVALANYYTPAPPAQPSPPRASGDDFLDPASSPPPPYATLRPPSPGLSPSDWSSSSQCSSCASSASSTPVVLSPILSGVPTDTPPASADSWQKKDTSIRAPQAQPYPDWLVRATGGTLSPFGGNNNRSQQQETPLEVRKKTPGTPEYMFLRGPEFPIIGYRMLGRTQDPLGMVSSAETITRVLRANSGSTGSKTWSAHDENAEGGGGESQNGGVGPEASLTWINSVIDSCTMNRIFWPLKEVAAKAQEKDEAEHVGGAATHSPEAAAAVLPHRARDPPAGAAGPTSPNHSAAARKIIKVSGRQQNTTTAHHHHRPLLSRRVFVRREDLAPVPYDSKYERKLAKKTAKRARRAEREHEREERHRARAERRDSRRSHRRAARHTRASAPSPQPGTKDAAEAVSPDADDTKRRRRCHLHHLHRSRRHSSKDAREDALDVAQATAAAPSVVAPVPNSHFKFQAHLAWIEHDDDDDGPHHGTTFPPSATSKAPRMMLGCTSGSHGLSKRSPSPQPSTAEPRRMRMLWGRSKSPNTK